MESHGYDTTGLSSSLLAAGLLVPSIITMYFITNTKKTKTGCKCTLCKKVVKKRKMNTHKIIMYVLIGLLVVPIYNIFFKEYNKNVLNNPYKLLNISQSASNKEIEKAYHKGVRKVKLTRTMDEQEKKTATQNIIKARELLIDTSARERWDTFGDVPMTNNHTIAIPSWVMSKYNPLLLMFFYVLVLGILLPRGVSYIWKYSFEYSSSGVLYRSTETLYRALKYTDVLDVTGLLVLINKYTVEISEYSVKTSDENIEQLKKIITEEYGSDLPLSTRSFVISKSILLLRNDTVLRLVDRSDIEYMQNELVLCVGAVRTLSIALKLTNLYYLSFDLERCIVQSIPHPKYYSMQKGLSFKEVFTSVYERATRVRSTDDKVSAKNTANASDSTDNTDTNMFRIRIGGVDIYNPIDGVVNKNGFLSEGADTIVKVSVFKERSTAKYLPVITKGPISKKNDLGDLADLEEFPEEMYPNALEKYPILIQGATNKAVHAPVYLEHTSYNWICTLEINSDIVMESPGFTPSDKGTEVFFKVPPMENITLSKKVEMAVKLSNGKYFDRDTSTKVTVLIK